MAVATPIPFVKAQFFDRCGNVLAGGKVFTYEPRSTTPKVTYNAPISGTPNTNPVILDAAGQADIYLYGRYRIIVQDAKGVVVNDSEDIGSWYSGDLDSQLDSVNQYLTDSGDALVASQQQRIDQMVNMGLVGAGSTDLLVVLSNGSGRSQKDKNGDTVGIFDSFTNAERMAYLAAPSTYNATVPVQRAITNLANGKELDFLGLTFSIGSKLSVNSKTGFVLKNGGIKALSTMITTSENQILFLNNCSQFGIQNFTVDGNRSQRTPAEQAIHSIVLRSCKVFTFTNVKGLNAVCDNLYFDTSTPTNLNTVTRLGVFINCDFDNAFRNNCSVIAARDLLFKNCSFTNANGTAPQSGVDIETNNYGVDGLISHIRFENCSYIGNNGWQFQSTIYDAPRGIRIVGGTVTSNKGLDTNANSGGVLIANDDTILEGVLFTDFTANSGYCVRAHATAGAFAQMIRCRFVNIAGSTIQSHGQSDGCLIDDCRFINTAGMNLNGADNIVKNSRFKNLTGTGVYGSSTGGPVEVNNCIIRGATGRGIFIESANAKIINNKIYDINTPIYWIQAAGAGAVVESNSCISSTLLDSQLAIRFAGDVGKSLRFNECINLHITDPYQITGSPTSALIGFNIGGTARVNTKNQTPMAIASMNSTQLPAANSVPSGTQVFCPNLGAVATSNATNWYVQGKLLDKQDIVYSAITALPAVNTGSQASITVTVTGAVMGSFVRCSYDLALAGTRIWAEVTAADTVTVYRRNDSGSNAIALNGRLNMRCELI